MSQCGEKLAAGLFLTGHFTRLDRKKYPLKYKSEREVGPPKNLLIVLQTNTVRFSRAYQASCIAEGKAALYFHFGFLKYLSAFVLGIPARAAQLISEGKTKNACRIFTSLGGLADAHRCVLVAAIDGVRVFGN
jgi:hypothetical protein